MLEIFKVVKDDSNPTKTSRNILLLTALLPSLLQLSVKHCRNEACSLMLIRVKPYASSVGCITDGTPG